MAYLCCRVANYQFRAAYTRTRDQLLFFQFCIPRSQVRNQVTMSESARKRAASTGAVEGRPFAGKRRRLPQTSDWILRDNAYKAWQNWDDPTARSLWIQGPAGTGKSYLAESIANSLAEENTSPNVSCFCDAVSTPASMFRGIFNQLSQSPSIGDETKRLITETSTRVSVDSGISPVDLSYKLWEGLVSIVSHIPRFRLVVDGVDEMASSYLAPEESSFVSRLINLTTVPGGHVRIVILSRPNPDIETALEGSPTIYITPERVEDDLRIFVEAEISAYPSLTASHDTLVPLVASRSEGLFLRASLMIQCLGQLASGLSDSVVEQAEQLDSSLDSLYQLYLKSQSLDAAQTAFRDIILRWLCVSVRPMSVAEIANVIAIETAAFMPAVASKALEVCGPLVKVDGESLRLAHHTLREFLVKKDPVTSQQSPSPWGYPQGELHLQVSRNLLAYLCQPQFSDIAVFSDNRLFHETHPIAEYATLYWPHHASLAAASNELLENIESFFDSPQQKEWQLRLFPMFFKNSVLPIPPRTDTNGIFFTLFMQKSKLVRLFPEDRRNAMEEKITSRFRAAQEDALEKARQNYNLDRKQDGVVISRRLLELAETYSWIKDYQEQTEGLLREACKLCPSDEQHPEGLNLAIRVHLALADAVKRDGKYGEAEEILKEATALAKAGKIEGSSLLMFAYDTLGWVSMRLGKLDDAASYLRQALRIAETKFGGLSPLTMRSQITLAEVLGKLGLAQEANALCSRLEKQLQRHYERGIALPKDSISHLNTLASLYMQQGKFEDAVKTYGVVVADRKEIFGLNGRMTIWAEMQLGFAMNKAGDREGAKELLEALLPRQIEALGPDHRDVKDVQAMLS